MSSVLFNHTPRSRVAIKQTRCIGIELQEYSLNSLSAVALGPISHPVTTRDVNKGPCCLCVAPVHMQTEPSLGAWREISTTGPVTL
eukprot:1145033-Pelagomonas_calceolata.AAC.12